MPIWFAVTLIVVLLDLSALAWFVLNAVTAPSVDDEFRSISYRNSRPTAWLKPTPLRSRERIDVSTVVPGPGDGSSPTVNT